MFHGVQAVTSSTGSMLSRAEQVLGLDRHNLSTDGKLVSALTERTVETFKTTTLGQIFSSDQFIKYDLLARNVLSEGYKPTTKVQVGSNGKVKEIKTKTGRYRQIGTSYYGNVDEKD